MSHTYDFGYSEVQVQPEQQGGRDTLSLSPNDKGTVFTVSTGS